MDPELPSEEGHVIDVDWGAYIAGQAPVPAEQLRRPQSVADIGRETAALYHTFGLETQRKKNLHLIEERKAVYVVGNAVIFEDLDSGVKTYLLGLDEGGVGCVGVHPCNKIFAVGGRGFQPKIYIYSYPALQVINILAGGAERGYASLNFNSHGNKLASVASAPDYMLTVWDWQEERIALHAKAFGQDVFDVKFSLDDDRRLVTSGTGHIRFWKMASTFTGLKLQGYIGKFGKIELSDIQAFVELPDGKVVSGTETGALLLWEGNFIKCRFVQVNGQPCHAGEITYVALDRTEKCVLTASVDGYIRWWDFSAIDAAEVDSDVTMDFELFPVAEFYLGAGRGVLNMVDGGVAATTVGGWARSMIIVDKTGCLETLKFDLTMPASPSSEEESSQQPLGHARLCDTVASFAQPASTDALPLSPPEIAVFSEFHAGRVLGMDSSPIEPLAATAGLDGTVRCWDIASKKVLTSKNFSSGGCSSLRWLPANVDSTGKHVLVGFSDGTTRLLVLGENDDCKPIWSRKMVFKPHNGPVTDLRFNDQGTLLATSGKDGNVFVFNCAETGGPNGSYTPLRFFVVNPASAGSKPTTCERLSWSADSKKLLCSCSDSILREVDVSLLLDRVTQDVETYEFLFPMVELAFKVQAMTSSESKANMSAAPGSPSAAGATAATGENEASSETKDADVAPTIIQSSSPSASPSSPSRKGIKDGETTDEVPTFPLKISSAVYCIGRADGANGTFVAATVGVPARAYFYECIMGQEMPEKELTVGVYSPFEGSKNAVKAPAITAITYSTSKKFLLLGLADGSVVVRPAAYPEIFFRVAAHNGAVGYVALSHDDRYLMSSGADGTLQVHVILPDLDAKADEHFKNVDASVFGDAVLKPPSKAQAPEPSFLHVLSSTDPSPLDQVQAVAAVDAVEASSTPSAESPAAAQEMTLKPSLPHVTSDNENIELPEGSYSIQDAKLKSEQDAKLLTADALKEKIRLVVKTLQRDYQRIVETNAALPAEIRVPASDLMIDGDIFDAIISQGEKGVSEVHKEQAYEAEKARRLREKIVSSLQSDMLAEEITLNSLSKSGRAKTLVKSLRAQGISPTVHALCEKVRESMRVDAIEEDKHRTEARLLGSGGGAVASMEDFVKEDATVDLDGVAGGSKTAGIAVSTGHGATAHASGPAHRREMRRQRKLKLKEHLKQKPNENDDDARDLAAIAHAEKTLGVCNLKGSDDYEVPEGQRINAEKMKQQMALLEDRMVGLRMEFNDRFVSLRDLKCDLIFSIKANNQRIREIDVELLQPELSAGSALWEPSLDVSEFPDDRGEVTEAELEKFMLDRKKTPWAKCPPVPHGSITNAKTKSLRNLNTGEYITSFIDLRERLSFGSVASAATEEDASMVAQVVDLEIPLTDPSKHLIAPRDQALMKDYQVDDNPLATFSANMSRKQMQRIINAVPVLQLARAGKQLKMSLPSSSQEDPAKAERRRVLEFERRKLLETIDTNLSAFEEAVNELRTERQQLTGELKQAELKLLTYFQSYQLLLQFEDRDLALQQKSLKSIKESGEIRGQVSELEVKLDGKREELKHWQEKGAAVTTEFRALVPENHAFVEQLNKIFRRKIKRSKLGGDAAGEEEEEQDMGEEDEDEEDDEDAEDVCPIGCDAALYDRVLELRARRTDVEDTTADVQKSIDDSRKALDRLKGRDKQVVKDLQNVDLEMRQFQKQKLAAMNQLEIYVPLKLAQIYAFETSGALTGPDVGGGGGAEIAGIEAGEGVAELRDGVNRKLASDMTMRTHVVINNK